MLSDCKYKISVLSPPNSTATFTELFFLLFPSNSVSLITKWVRISGNIALSLGYLNPFHRLNFFGLVFLCPFTSHINFLHYSFYQVLFPFLSIFVTAFIFLVRLVLLSHCLLSHFSL